MEAVIGIYENYTGVKYILHVVQTEFMQNLLNT